MTDPDRTILPAETFDRLAAELDGPARVVEPLLDLARRVNNAQRSDWFSQQYEAWTPTDAAERAEYLAQLAEEAEHGPAA